jgi:hypothetical protein
MVLIALPSGAEAQPAGSVEVTVTVAEPVEVCLLIDAGVFDAAGALSCLRALLGPPWSRVSGYVSAVLGCWGAPRVSCAFPSKDAGNLPAGAPT